MFHHSGAKLVVPQRLRKHVARAGFRVVPEPVDETPEACAVRMTAFALESTGCETCEKDRIDGVDYAVGRGPRCLFEEAGARQSRRVNLVDLAGNERVSKSGSMEQRLEEAKAINKS
eukprot:3321851-Rhodomonas_salina.1